MVPRDSRSEVTPFVRRSVGDSANVLLIASDDAPAAGIACQNILTTASERTERNLVIEYGASNRTWLDGLRYEPINLRRTQIHEGDGLPANVREFLEELGEEEIGVVYVDSISAMVSDIGVDDTVAALSDTLRTLATTDVSGLFRIDPDVVTPISFQRLVDYTATYVPGEQGWQISKTEA